MSSFIRCFLFPFSFAGLLLSVVFGDVIPREVDSLLAPGEARLVERIDPPDGEGALERIMGTESPEVMLGGDPVYADEDAFHESRVRTEVASRFMRTHGISMSPDFWTTPYEGVSPADLLQQEVLRSIARVRAIQSLAVERGILVESRSYRQFLGEFQAENRKRKEMKAAGEVFYGPVAFRQETYFEIWLEQIVKAIQLQILRNLEKTTDEIPGESVKRNKSLAELETTVRERFQREVQTRMEEMMERSEYHP